MTSDLKDWLLLINHNVFINWELFQELYRLGDEVDNFL